MAFKSGFTTIDPNKMTFEEKCVLNIHPFAYITLLKYPELILDEVIQYNCNNTPIYQKYPNKITWEALKRNPELKSLVTTDPSKIKW